MAHGLIKPHTSLKHPAGDQAACLADVVLRMGQHGVHPAVVKIRGDPEHVDIRVDPGYILIAGHSGIGPAQSRRIQAVIGIQQIDRGNARPTVQREPDPGIARRAEAAIRAPDIKYLPRITQRKGRTNLMRFHQGATIVHQHNHDILFAILRQDGGNCLA